MRKSIILTREKLIEDFKVDAQGIIQAEGRYQGQALYMPYFMALFYMGVEDQVTETPEGDVITIHVKPLDQVSFPELGVKESIKFHAGTGHEIL